MALADSLTPQNAPAGPRPDRWRVYSLVLLGLIVALGAFLRFYQLGAGGYGNEYYAAAVKSMLSSWHNFFFVSFEPGGSVSVDKPPLGFWIETASALLFGLNGFSLAFPNALAGVLAIPLLYSMVKRPFGAAAGLVAALVLAVMPVAIVTERNNTIDGLLTFVVLLAAWAGLRSVYSGKLRFLLLGAVLLGLGFNIKMLAAFMPLPALYLLYLLGAPHRWLKRLGHLALASLVLLVVSFSWAVAVDATPAADRPYVGSSTDNSVTELIFGWNGLSRLFRGGGLASVPGLSGLFPPAGGPAGQAGPAGGFGRPAAGGQAQAPFGGPLAGGGFDTGSPGPLRLFTEPLVEEASWLLPLALLAIPLAAGAVFLLRRRTHASNGVFDPPEGGSNTPLKKYLLALLLWGVWLVAEVLYFSFTTGLIHQYYLILLGPPLAALVGAGVWALAQAIRFQRWAGWGLAVLLVSLAAAFQISILKSYPEYAGLAALVAGAGEAGAILLAWRPRSWQPQAAALGVICTSLLAIPLTWSLNITLNPSVESALPSANQLRSGSGGGLFGGRSDGGGRQFAGGPSFGQSGGFPAPQGVPGGSGAQAPENSPDQTLITFLEANTAPGSYLLAVDSAQEASPLILATGRPVLTFGGFTGSDPVVDPQKLSQLVAADQLRYILTSFQVSRQKPDLAAWITQNCRQTSAAPSGGISGFGGRGGGGTLYDCGQQ